MRVCACACVCTVPWHRTAGPHSTHSLFCSPAESLVLTMEPSKKTDAAGPLQTNPPLRLHPDRGAPVLAPEQGGYKERFVKPVEDKYKCEKCRLVLCNPKQTECGHRFCDSCMAAVLR